MCFKGDENSIVWNYVNVLVYQYQQVEEVFFVGRRVEV